MIMKARATVNFKGRVQGVFFRANTRDFAEQVGVFGWVRNLPDGSVEAVFEGDKEGIEGLIAMCKTKQPHARVSSAKVQWDDYKGEFNGFEIRY
jgi:acylphosphatase